MRFTDLVSDADWVARTERQTGKRQSSARAIAVEKSGNSKTGVVHATYVTQASCGECPLMGEACYAESGYVAMTTSRLNRAAVSGGEIAGPEEIAKEEAAGIDRLSATLPLRLHVVGDCKTNESASIVAEACERFVDRSPNGSKPWSYTHAWREVDRAAWGSVDISASCDTPDQIQEAEDRGYATVLTVADMPPTPVVALGDGRRGVVCPQQRGITNCSDCRGLCRDTDNMRAKRLTVLFALHGAKAERGKNRLLGIDR